MVRHTKPSQAELDRRKIIGINAQTITDIHSTDFPGHYPGEDNSWSIDSFAANLECQIHHNLPLDLNFSLVGIDASIANAFRRIMIAEIPTLAIEYVFVNNNTSIIQDEVLAHRLGLIPLKGGKDGLLNFLKWYKKPDEDDPTQHSPYDFNTIILRLNVECTRNPEAAKGETDPLKAYHNAHVYAHQLEYIPVGRQTSYFSDDNAIQAVNPNILIAKLRPGQLFSVDLHAIKGIGADHAKFSPVATASYRLLPTITLLKPILGQEAEKFARCFPKGVIGFETVTRKESQKKGSGFEGYEGEKKAVVLNPMLDTVSREVLRHEEFDGKVKLGRRRDHFIFSVESTGQWDSDELFLESIKVLKEKCERLKRNLNRMLH